MKATGIVRRIDDLGRVVVPKEIRRTQRIREGDPLEIFTDREGQIILKKFSPIGELGAIARQYAYSLAQTMKCTVCITDTDQIIAAAGAGREDLQDRYIEPELEKLMKERKMAVSKDQIVCPIISQGDVLGSIVFTSSDEKKPMKELEEKMIIAAAGFLALQLEG
ncbi:MAG: stage V sporulation T C-terminal domain-containing protein [Hespellia sp.]|nr:stage V sporulation T C-terminal domain-containing protein [Hespellia sp.]